MGKAFDFLTAAFAGFAFGGYLGLLTAFWIGLKYEKDYWQTVTIERGLAQYCPTNGEWAWKGECND
jgi:hypothetical protein